MAVRSLTESFVFMRNNAVQNKLLFADNTRPTQNEGLLFQPNSQSDIESGRQSRIMAEWQKQVNAVNFTFTIIRQKIKDLITLHERHLMATNLDDNVAEDQEIERQTKELTQLFTLSHRQLGQLVGLRNRGSSVSQTQKVSENVIASAARQLQELSLSVRQSQSRYLKNLKMRDERIQAYLPFSDPLSDTMAFTSDDFGEEEYEYWQTQQQQHQSLLLAENTRIVAERETEINEIVRSIYELNEIFRDVAQMVVDQGTLVDRVDFNVENTQVRVGEALTQLSKAQAYQSKDRKLVIIMVLAAMVVVFGILLIVTKFT